MSAGRGGVDESEVVAVSDRGASSPAKHDNLTKWAGVSRSRYLEGSILPIAWILAIVMFSLIEGSKFLTIGNFSNIFGSQAVIFILTIGLVAPLTNGDLDLSVGGTAGLVSAAVTVLNVNSGLPIAWSCVVGLLIGALGGLLNGAIVLRFDVDPLIITLGTGTIFTGIEYYLTNDQTVTGIASSLSEWTFGYRILDIPIEFYYGLAAMTVMWFIMTFTAYGQRSLFVGSSREVAALSGFAVGRMRIQGFVVAGTVAAMAGILFVGTSGSATPGSAEALLLPAYAAAFLGRTTLQPGRFNAPGSCLAVYFLATGVSGIELMGAQAYVQNIFYGGVLVVAVVLSRVFRRTAAGAR